MRKYLIILTIFLFGFSTPIFAQISDADFEFIISGCAQNDKINEERKERENELREKQQQRSFYANQKRAYEVADAERSAREEREKKKVALEQALKTVQLSNQNFREQMEESHSRFSQKNISRRQQQQERNRQFLNKTIERGQEANEIAEELNRQNLLELRQMSDLYTKGMPPINTAFEPDSNNTNRINSQADTSQISLITHDLQVPALIEQQPTADQAVKPDIPLYLMTNDDYDVLQRTPQALLRNEDFAQVSAPFYPVFAADGIPNSNIIEENISQDDGCDPWIRWGGAFDLLLGTIQTTSCGVAAVITAPTGLGSIASGICAFNGIDNATAGGKQFWTCEPQTTVTQELIERSTGSSFFAQVTDIADGLINPNIASKILGGKTIIGTAKSIATNAANGIKNTATKIKNWWKGKPVQSTAVFPDNPRDFNPIGLERREYKNDGEIIKWHDNETNKAIYEWNADESMGHYHMTPDGKHRIRHPDTGDTHIRPGTNIPE